MVGVALAEVVLRVYTRVADNGLTQALDVDPYRVQVEPHGVAGFRPKPGKTFAYEDGTAAHVNEMGFRGPPVDVPKPRGVFRIILLGGSTTFGWGVEDSETIDAYMRSILASRYPERRVEVVNLAFDGYDSYQLVERLRSDGLRLEPDAVIVNSGVNDVRNARYAHILDGDPRTLLYRATLDQLRLEEALGHPTLWTRAKHWLYLARLPGWIEQQLAGGPPRLPSPDRDYRWDALDYFQRNLTRLLELTSQVDAVLLLSTPSSSLSTRYEPADPPRASYWIRDARTTQMYRDSLDGRMRAFVDREVARGEGGRVAYVRRSTLAPDMFLDDAHLTPAGNRRVAEDFVTALAPWLAEVALPARP